MNAWDLMKGDELLGHLDLRNIDQPIFFCTFIPTEAFDRYRPLFEGELALLEEDRLKEWEAAYQKIDDLGLILRSTENGDTIDDFLLHIDGDEAWFRY
ncbi:MAG: hypothetical protein KY468_19820 [Armatimonadetes bacterium]|nr:hypothetical protein [Armatimonadota bacterium]